MGSTGFDNKKGKLSIVEEKKVQDPLMKMEEIKKIEKLELSLDLKNLNMKATKYVIKPQSSELADYLDQ